MAEWNGEYVSPYAEHGKKSEQVKKITVSIPLKVLKILTDERTLYTVEINHVTLVAINSGAQYGALVLRKGYNAGQT